MNNKTDLIIMLLMIIGNIGFSTGMIFTCPVSTPNIIILSVWIFCLLCLLGIYAHKLYNIHKGEKEKWPNPEGKMYIIGDKYYYPTSERPLKYTKGQHLMNLQGTHFYVIEDIEPLKNEFSYVLRDLTNGTIEKKRSSMIDDYNFLRLANRFEIEEHIKKHQNGITPSTNE